MKKRLLKRPLSHSQLSTWEFDPELWYRRYILNEKQKDNAEMIFGRKFAKSIEDGKPMAPVTIIGKAEYPFNVMFNGIALTGFADNFCEKTKRKLMEYKTSQKPWTQDRVDKHGQLSMYALMNFITNKVPPEELEIVLENVLVQSNGDYTLELVKPIQILRFKTKRTMKDILEYGAYINKTVKDMDDFIKSYPLAKAN